MTKPSEPVSEMDLHAFVDGQLDEARQREVAAHLAENPEAAARVAAYRAQKTALKAAFDPILKEPLPRQLGLPTASRRTLHARWAAAAAGLLVAGGVLGWQAGGMFTPAAAPGTAVVHQAAVAHAVFTPQKRHPVEVRGDEEAHLVTWLSNVLGAPLRAPRLVDAGYLLVGGRLLSATDGPAAQFMYEDKGGRRLTLYVVTDPAQRGKTAFRYAEEKGVAIFYWIDGPLGYALAGKMTREELLKLADAVYTQLGR
ncbi:MAG: anti-sigma factor [Rhodospirillales bacterium]|nr:anti-sigma factor [Rhodospirillales bacterium]